MQQIMDRKGGVGTVRHYVEELAVGFQSKMILSIAGSVIATLEGFYGELVWGFLALFALDLLSGILKSKKNGIPISSRRLRDSVTKLCAYMVAITALLVAGKYEPTFIPVVTLAYYYFMFTEVKSIFENVEEMGIKIPFFIKDKIQSKLNDTDPVGIALEKKEGEDKNGTSE